MKISFKYILSVLVSGVMLSGCLPDPAEEALAYQGPTVVEFKNHTLGMVNNATFGLDYRGILSSSGSTQTDSSRVISLAGYSVTNSEGRVTRVISPRTVDTIFVQLVGPQRSAETVVNFEVKTTSTAVEGTDYTLEPADTRTVTIPANSSQGRILIRPNAASFTGTERKRLDLRLVGAENATPNPNYDTFYVTMTRTF